MGFALPSGKVLSIANEIIKYGKVSRAWIGEFRFRRGFYTDPDTNNKIPALYTVSLNNNSNFENGLKDGDIIIAIKNTDARWNTLLASVNSISPGDILELKIIRSNDELELNLVTKERPNRPQVL